MAKRTYKEGRSDCTQLLTRGGGGGGEDCLQAKERAGRMALPNSHIITPASHFFTLIFKSCTYDIHVVIFSTTALAMIVRP